MSFPESPVPLNGEPLATDEHVAQRSVSVFTLHSKSPFGMFLNNPVDDTPFGPDLRELVIAGSGIYVVDCPIGWPGRLVLNDDVEYEIFPGLRITDRYTRVKLIKAPAATAGLISDSPIILALGPRGHEYSRPGLRYHLWRPRSTGYEALSVGGVTTGPLSTTMQTAGYDFWCMLLAITNNVVGDSFGVTVEYTPFNVINPVAPALTRYSQISDVFTGGADFFTPAYGTGPLYNQAVGSKAVATLDGQTTFDFRQAGGIRGNPALPDAFGWVQKSTAFLISNRAAGAKTISMSVVGAVRVD